MTANKPYIILLEEDPDDRMIVDIISQQLGYGIEFRYLTYSDQLFSFLESGEKPSLIMVDYNSKPQSGVEVLKRLKSDSVYQSIPVIVLGESDHKPYITECYKLGASSFIVKPGTYDESTQKIRTFLEYWFHVVEL